MRTFLYRPGTFLTLLVVCLMFAPARQVTGDREVAGRPAAALPDPPAAPASKSFGELCRDDPVQAVARSLRKYQAEVEGYSCTLLKRERINGELRPLETIACDFRQAPFAVLLRWRDGKNRADAILYSAGENRDQLLIIPASDTLKAGLRLLGRTYAERGLTSDDARAAARYPANEFGLYHASARVYENWKTAQRQGTLRTQYEGIRAVPELTGRPCHVVRRTCVVPEDEGLTQVTLYFDTESLLQVGAVLMAGDSLLASYHFRDVKLNPRFDARHFAADRFR